MHRHDYDYAYLEVNAVRKLNEPPFFTTSQDITLMEMRNGFGGIYGSGGSVYCSKHLDLLLQGFKDRAVGYGVTSDHIEIVWAEGAKTLYEEELKDARVYPDHITASSVEKYLNEEAYNLWRDMGQSFPSVDYVRWFLEDHGKTPEEIEDIFQKSRQIGYKQLYDQTLESIAYHKKHYIEEQYRELMEMKVKIILGEKVKAKEGYGSLEKLLEDFEKEVEELEAKQLKLEKYGKAVGVLDVPDCRRWLVPVTEKIHEAYKDVDLDELDSLYKIIEKKEKVEKIREGKSKAKRKRRSKKPPKAVDISDMMKQSGVEPEHEPESKPEESKTMDKPSEELNFSAEALETAKIMTQQKLGQVPEKPIKEKKTKPHSNESEDEVVKEVGFLTEAHLPNGKIIRFPTEEEQKPILEKMNKDLLEKMNPEIEKMNKEVDELKIGEERQKEQKEETDLSKVSAEELKRLIRLGHPPNVSRFDVLEEIERRGLKLLEELGWSTDLDSHYENLHNYEVETLRSILYKHIDGSEKESSEEEAKYNLFGVIEHYKPTGKAESVYPPLTSEDEIYAIKTMIGHVTEDHIPTYAYSTYKDSGRKEAIDFLRKQIKDAGKYRPKKPSVTGTPKGILVYYKEEVEKRLIPYSRVLNHIIAKKTMNNLDSFF